MPTTYRIHPGIGIARLGNSPDAFCISPEQPAALPIDCDQRGNPLVTPDGLTELRVKTFKDAEGRIKRQAARFQIWAYDDESPNGRPLKLGDQIEGGGNAGTLIDIQWRVYLANKKSCWYQFLQLQGEHGYDPSHPLRNAAITDENARQRLIIDPGPRTVDHQTTRTAHFSRDGGDNYATTFPPPLQPNSIDTLGDLLTDDTGRLLVLGGHGNSGSYLFDDFGQPRIVNYANNDGWFDDTSDGPVMARLAMFSSLVGGSPLRRRRVPSLGRVCVSGLRTGDSRCGDDGRRDRGHGYPQVRGADRYLWHVGHVRRSAAHRADRRRCVDSLAGRARALEPGLQALVLSRHLEHSLSTRSIQLSLRRPRPVELSAQSVDARYF